MESDVIHPISFFNNDVLQSKDIGNPELYPILQQIQHVNSGTSNSINEFLRDFIINNISGLSTTFIIKLLEDNINKDEVAYMVDFYSDFNIKDYLLNTITKYSLFNKTPDTICNMIQSNIIFILNQFIQFYTMYKLIYDKEGVDLYSFLCKETYGDIIDMNMQDKYVFCNSIMNNMLEDIVPNIKECSIALKNTITNIKNLNGGY